MGRPASDLVAGVLRLAREHALSVEYLAADEIRKRYPAFRPEDDQVGVLEHNAGFLAVERCVLAHVRAAQRLGAEIHSDEPVLSWRADQAAVEVTTQRATYRAARLVLTAGAWTAALLASLGSSLSVMRQVAIWFQPTDPSLFRRDRFPIFITDEDFGYFYGIPMIDSAGVKVSRGITAHPSVRAPMRSIVQRNRAMNNPSGIF